VRTRRGRYGYGHAYYAGRSAESIKNAELREEQNAPA
jgi:hypothetical protein